jgi:hypothetical protein
MFRRTSSQGPTSLSTTSATGSGTCRWRTTAGVGPGKGANGAGAFAAQGDLAARAVDWYRHYVSRRWWHTRVETVKRDRLARKIATSGASDSSMGCTRQRLDHARLGLSRSSSSNRLKRRVPRMGSSCIYLAVRYSLQCCTLTRPPLVRTHTSNPAFPTGVGWEVSFPLLWRC